MELFMETLKLAKELGALFNGVLCGRATWQDAIPEFSEKGIDSAENWLLKTGVENISKLNEYINKFATPWSEKISVIE